jgi:hypothetical protein
MSDIVEKQVALQSTETMATVVHAIVRQQYGEPAYEWDPATVSLELRADFNAEISSPVMDRWCAMQTTLTSDAFFQRIDAFLNICNTLSSGVPTFQVFDPVTVEEAAWGLTEVALNREMLPLSNTVKNYLRTILKQDHYEEEDYPQIFREVLLGEHKHDTPPSSFENTGNVEAYVDEQLKDLMYQIGKIPTLRGQDIILARAMEEFVGTSS